MKLYLNNKKTTHREFGKVFKSIQNKKILQSKGGYLFKSSINKSEFHMGIIPVIIEGERTHHYDIKLDYEDDYIFSGFFNGNGTLGILFTPPGKKDEISSEFKENLKSVYLETLGVLTQNGISEKMELDWISQKMIGEIDIFHPVPQNIHDLLLMK